MKKYILSITLMFFSIGVFAQYKEIPSSNALRNAPEVKINKDVLKDKIKGGWAAQTIGVTFGGPTEFRYNSTMIPDYRPIKWYDGYMKDTYENEPGLYDDIYMDLTFVEVIENEGIDAPAESYAMAFANADYTLWHANQAARYNILNGIMPPMSGHWENNPHADDIDYQIEADFAGLMSPGLPNAASEISDKVGHIMNYGDGWYGGVYIGAMYSLAFISDDIEFIVTEALKSIPEKSEFYQCVNDVIINYKKYPTDWKQTWFEIHRKWTDEVGCPDGVFSPFNIDAKINAAWVVLGLLYGEGDFSKTYEISTRAGDDSDCNPASAGGILGVIHGYDKIPEYWKMGLAEVEPINFKYTNISLNKVYDLSYKHALEVIQRNGGTINEDHVIIRTDDIKQVRFEKSFEGHFPIKKTPVNKDLKDEYEFDFEGIGFVLGGTTAKFGDKGEHVYLAELYIDGNYVETVKFPTHYDKRRHELFWKYKMENKKHHVKVKLLNPNNDHRFRIGDLLIYGDKPLPKPY